MINQFDIWLLFAGLGVFLFGMRQLENSLAKLAGEGFRNFLRNSTSKPTGSIITGILSTTIVQSSSLVGLIVLAFVGAGILPLINAIGIVLGSNLGTTFTGWIVTSLGFKMELSTAIYPMLGLGGLGYGLFQGKLKYYSQLLFGLALLLMGLDFMKESAAVLQTYFDIEVLRDYPSIVFLLVGVVFTAIIQSSSATMMLTLSALYAGIIPLPAAAALVIGADLGTTSTVLLGSLQGAVAKRQLAMAHVTFNLIVDALAFLALYPLLDFIHWLNVHDPMYSLVLFHSLFNVIGIVLFLPVLKQFSEWIQGWIKEDKRTLDLHIQSVSVDIADAAITALTRDTHQLLYLISILNMRFLRININLFKINSPTSKMPPQLMQMGRLKHYETIKELEGKLIHYALKIDSQMLTEKDTQQLNQLLDAIRSGVYSAKSLKDIEDDLLLFEKLDNPLITEFSTELRNKSTHHYQQILALVEGIHQANYMHEEISSLQKKSYEYHHVLEGTIYKKSYESDLSAIYFSTLLNVNKEIQTSEKAFLKALAIISS